MGSKYILGAGINGLLARDILGKDWKIIPFGISRFYSTHPIVEDHIDYHLEIEQYLSKHFNTNNILIPKRRFSYNGELIKDNDFWPLHYNNIYEELNTIHHMSRISKIDMMCFNSSICDLYKKLYKKYASEFYDKKIEKIENHHIVFKDSSKHEYNKIISTIPLNVLFKLMGKDGEFVFYDATILNATMNNDIDGCDVIYVCDGGFPFNKVIKQNKYYSFIMKGKLNSEPILLRSIIGDYKQLGLYYVENYYSEFNFHDKIPNNIFLIGQHARLDDAYSVGTSILNLLKYNYE